MTKAGDLAGLDGKIVSGGDIHICIVHYILAPLLPFYGVIHYIVADLAIQALTANSLYISGRYNFSGKYT
jgi:hypothetical protein